MIKDWVSMAELNSVGISYKKADVSIRGKFSLSQDRQVELLKKAKELKITGLFLLSTCNRTEIVGFTSPEIMMDLLCEFSSGQPHELIDICTIRSGKKCVKHLFRVGTGLESQILGDYEIVGQMKTAFKLAKEIEALNPYLERLLNQVLKASKMVKNQTSLSSGTTSVSYAAVQYMINNVEGYNDKNILVYGLGKMGRNTCKNIIKYTENRGTTLINRTFEKTEAFVSDHPEIHRAKAENIQELLKSTDILVVSTSADEPTITDEHLVIDKPLLVLDLSMPSNVKVDVNVFPDVTLINVDQLSKITDDTLALRKSQVPKAEEIIQQHKDEFLEWESHRKYAPAINALKNSLLSIKEEQIDFHRKNLDNFDENQAEIVTTKLIQKITTKFARHFKDENSSIDANMQLIKEIFGH